MFLRGHDDITTTWTWYRLPTYMSFWHTHSRQPSWSSRQASCKTILASSDTGVRRLTMTLTIWKDLLTWCFIKIPQNKVRRDNVPIHLYLFKWRFLCTGTWKTLSNNNRESKLPKWGSSITSDVRRIGEQTQAYSQKMAFAIVGSSINQTCVLSTD